MISDLVARAGLTFMRRGVPVLGEREVRLLQAVDRVQSIKEAAREAGISYRTAWSAIQIIERALGRPVVASRAGGPGGGGTTLTDECRQLLERYRELRARLDAALASAWPADEAAAV